MVFAVTPHTTVKRKEKENFTVTDARGTHTAMLRGQCYATQAPPGSNTITTKTIHRNYTIPPAEPNYNNYNNSNTRQSPAPSSAGSTVDITQMFVMHLDKNRQQTKLIDDRKDLLANVSTYDEKDKKACLMWIQPV